MKSGTKYEPPAKRNMLVWVYWRDAVSRQVMAGDYESATLAVQASLGWIVHETDETIVLAYAECEGQQYVDVIARDDVLEICKI